MHALENLRKSPGWALLAKYVHQQIEARKQEIAFTDLSYDDIQKLRGEISAIYTFSELPDVIVEELESNVKAREAELAAEQNEDTGHGNPI